MITGYVLVEKGKDKPIKIEVANDRDESLSITVFEYKKDIVMATDIEKEFEEIKKVEIKIL
jgi:hypothetical protein